MDDCIVQRIKKIMDFYKLNQTSFSERVGLKQSNLSKILSGERTCGDAVINKISMSFDIRKEWLLTGDGEMLKEQSPAEDIAEESIDREYTTYLLPLSAMAGQLSGLATDGVFQSECEKIISPIKGVDFAITIHGDSMHPEYPSGSRILIKKINPSIFIEWGKVYVLDTDNGVVVKEIHKCENKENYITCHSINPDPKFADFDVNINEIHGMYRVLMCLSAK